MSYQPDYPDTPTTQPQPRRSPERGPDARDLIAEIQRVIEANGNPIECPVHVAEFPNNSRDVWVTVTPRFQINVCLPPAR